MNGIGSCVSLSMILVALASGLCSIKVNDISFVNATACNHLVDSRDSIEMVGWTISYSYTIDIH